MKGRLRQPIWIVPLAIAGVVAVSGWWANARLRQAIEERLKLELTTTLEANVTALEIWLANQEKVATALAGEPALRTLASQVLEAPTPSPADNRPLGDLPQADELNNYLRGRLAAVGYDMANLVNTNSYVVANSRGGRFRGGGPVSEAHQAKFAELFASGQPVIIAPFKPVPPGPRRPFSEGPRGAPGGGNRPGDALPAAPPRGSGEARPGARPPSPGPGRGRRGDLTLMQVAAPVRDAQGTVRGALALIINPEKEFSRILSVARSGRSGETYAFDQSGLMLSRSRFDDQLKQLGLIEDRSGASSAVTLPLTDPGGDLTKGFRVAEASSASTRMVAAAVAGGAGVTVQPTRDYRGVPVVGAWRWLSHYGFGVVTQIDAQEAFEPLRVPKLVFIVLFLLLVLCANAMFLFTYLNVLWRRRFSEAELKVRQLGQYTLEERIGEGGMGVVYRARHALLRRDTAVKLLLPDRADPTAVRRFEREVRLSCQLTHPNTIQVYDYGHTPEGIFYYAMEYLRGLNLRELVARFGPQPEPRVIHILTQVCDSLAEAHALGLVHRDIKPENVLICDRGGVPDSVKVLDFGLVRQYLVAEHDDLRLTDTQVAIGTPVFMPPEAMKDPARSDPRGDLYSVGALGYYLLTGAHVFQAASVLELYEKHLTQSPIPPGRRTANPVSAELEATVLRCLAKAPEQRPQSAGELRRLLQASPRATEWGVEARAAWWAGHRGQEGSAPRTTEHRLASPVAATVKINLADRSP